MNGTPLTWLEVDVAALQSNAAAFKKRVGEACVFAPVVKSNGYGHGLELAARAFESGGADWLCVHELSEALALRQKGIHLPIYVVGLVPPEDAHLLVERGIRVVAYDSELVDAIERVSGPNTAPVPLHVKLETGNYRQGLEPAAAHALCRRIHASEAASLEGVSTHFADVEDTTDHGFARQQLAALEAFVQRCEESGIPVPMVHSANSAATLLWSHAHRQMVRTGIAAYGLWPSKETLISALQGQKSGLELQRALTWKARVAQVKDVPVGAYVGYGRTYRATHPSRIAVVCVGYYDGYDRKFSNQAYVLIRGHRAPVRGRVCMNLVMVDVTHVPEIHAGDEVVLLGRSGEEEITAEMMGDWAGTIHYEIISRIHERLPRIPVKNVR